MRRLAIAAALAILYVAPPTLLWLHQYLSTTPATPLVNKLAIASVILVFQPGLFVFILLLPHLQHLPVVEGNPLAIAEAIILLSSALFWTIVFYLLLTALHRYRNRSTSTTRQNPPSPPHVN